MRTLRRRPTLRRRSSPADQLTTFLYVLLRDHLPFGQVELLVREHVEKSIGQDSIYSHGDVARYAESLAIRILRKPPNASDIALVARYRPKTSPQADPELDPEVARLRGRGMTVKKIAKKLRLSDSTIWRSLRRIRKGS